LKEGPAGGWEIVTSSYQAKVATDGCLTNIRVGAEEFLLPDVGISRGTYLHQGGALKLGKPSKVGDSSLESESPMGRVRYDFSEVEMTWTVENRTSQPMRFFAILPQSIDVAAGPDGVVVDMPAERAWSESRWYGQIAKLEFSTTGPARQWAWQLNSTVWEVALKPKETRRVSVKVGAIEAADRKAIHVLKPPPSDLRVDLPRDLEVFQRAKLDSGPVRVAGRVVVPADIVKFRFTGKDRRARDLAGNWSETKVGPDGAYAVEVTLPAGGWYALELTALKDGKEVASERVGRVGVGEVFVGAGQSNSTSCGGIGTNHPLDGRMQPASGLVSTFDGRNWRIADDPQPGAHDKHAGGSFWPTFGDVMVARFGVPVGVAVTGHGGTSINVWKTDSELFRWTLARVEALEAGRQGGSRRNPGFRALLWHQGESDAKTMDAAGYSGGLGLIIKDMRTRAGWKFPWFVAQATYHPGMPPFAGVRAGQKKLWTSGLALEGPDTDAMVGELRDNGGKGIHFSKKGLKVHGEAWAEKVGDWLEKELRR
jgi:hypothetical protein